MNPITDRQRSRTAEETRVEKEGRLPSLLALDDTFLESRFTKLSRSLGN
jgi:hypothetical protein